MYNILMYNIIDALFLPAQSIIAVINLKYLQNFIIIPAIFGIILKLNTLKFQEMKMILKERN